jgi:dUTP pyrophosphatase
MGINDAESRIDSSQEWLSVEIVRLPHGLDLPLPAYATLGSVGADLHAAIDAPIVVRKGEIQLIPTGVAIALPAGFEAQLRPRSGLSLKHGIIMVNSPGTIDWDYRGELKVALTCVLNNPVAINRGDRIAQLVVSPIVRCQWVLTRNLSTTQRAEGGFGHTGVQPLTLNQEC